MGERDFIALLDGVHHLVKAPMVLVWDRLNTHVSRQMQDLVEGNPIRPRCFERALCLAARGRQNTARPRDGGCPGAVSRGTARGSGVHLT